MAPDALLSETDPPPFETATEAGRAPFVLTCDHAGRAIPAALGDLGVPESELIRHIAWDIGVAGLGRALSERLDAVLILQSYSRLVIDVNRPPGASDSIATLSERTPIPGNFDLSPEAATQRERAIFWPYHKRIQRELDRRLSAHEPTVLVALHSFTPRFKDVDRVWHAGVLYGRDARFAREMLKHLRADENLVVGENEPYAVSDDSDFSVLTHGEARGIHHVELEIRQDLIADAAGQQRWAERLASALRASFSALFPA